MAGKVKNDLIDLQSFYQHISTVRYIEEVRATCLSVIEGSVGKQTSKDRFIRLIKSANRIDRMIKLVTDYALAGQGLSVLKV